MTGPACMRPETRCDRIPQRITHENNAKAPTDAYAEASGPVVASTSKDKDGTASWPQTRCAKCQTVFEVPADLLESSDTRVRCGECLSIFDALQGVAQQKQLAKQRDQLAQASSSEEETSRVSTHQVEGVEEFSNLDVTYSDFDLFSNEAELPEVPYKAGQKERVEFNFDSVEIDHDQTFSDTLFANDVTIDADLPLRSAKFDDTMSGNDAIGPDRSETQLGATRAHEITDLAVQAKVSFSENRTGPPADPLVFQYHDPDDTGEVSQGGDPGLPELVDTMDLSDHVPAPRRGHWIKFVLGALVLALLIASLYLFRERARLYNNPQIRPIYENFCSVVGCTVPLPFDPEQMGLMRRSIYPHPEVEDALVINVVIKNKANFAQRYPVLVIRLEETSGKPLATRDFPPQEYLEPRIWRDSTTIDAGAAISITLEIKDPGEKAGSFTLKFR